MFRNDGNCEYVCVASSNTLHLSTEPRYAVLLLSTTGETAMARTLATLPEGSRITDYISLGVITKTFPLKRVRAVLAATSKASQRERDLPAHVVVYYAIALALYMQL